MVNPKASCSAFICTDIVKPLADLVDPTYCPSKYHYILGLEWIKIRQIFWRFFSVFMRLPLAFFVLLALSHNLFFSFVWYWRSLQVFLGYDRFSLVSVTWYYQLQHCAYLILNYLGVNIHNYQALVCLLLFHFSSSLSFNSARNCRGRKWYNPLLPSS